MVRWEAAGLWRVSEEGESGAKNAMCPLGGRRQRVKPKPSPSMVTDAIGTPHTSRRFHASGTLT